MANALTDCLCSECQSLDALPSHRQGIPGARQQTFVEAPALAPWQQRRLDKASADNGTPLLDFAGEKAHG